MFHHPAWAVGSYSSGPPAGELPKYKSTKPCARLPGPGHAVFTFILGGGVVKALDVGNVEGGGGQREKAAGWLLNFFAPLARGLPTQDA